MEGLSNINPIAYLLCGGFCLLSVGGLAVGATLLYAARNNPLSRMGRALEHRVATPRPITVVHKTVHQAPKAPIPESVALKKWQTIQVWTAIISVVALIVGAVFLGLGDIAVLIIAALANTFVAGLKWFAANQLGDHGGAITKR